MPEISIDNSLQKEPAAAVKPHGFPIAKIAFPLVLAVTGVILLGLFLSILKLNNGAFIYTMDDPYIALSLSDQIRHGNYGMNAGLHASPASSILFPFLLVPASGTPLHPYLPLILSWMALFATLFIMWRLFKHLRLAEDTFGIVAQAAAVLLLAICLNLIGVAFCGLEHSLHIAAVAACIYGLALFLDSGKMPAWLPAVIVINPLLRYEGLALSFGAILIIALRGRWRAAAGTFALIVLFIGGFFAFLVSLGLPPLPSSILSKSDVVANGIGGARTDFLESIGQNVSNMDSIPAGALLLVVGVAAAARCFREFPARPWRWTSQGLMALLLVCLIGAHAVAGQFGWLDRYEDYALLGAALIGICLMRETIRSVLANRKGRLISFCGTAAALAVFCAPYIGETWKVPLAANNIYEQQLQMHRFVNDFYRAPVAVNDLGLVSYHNPNFVLDLGGLASEEARILKSDEADADAYRAFVDRNGVHLVVIYDEWFEGQIPASWVKVASMDLSRECVSSNQKEVQFYATDASTAGKLRPELESFSRGLPPGVKLTIYGAAGDAGREAAQF
ncbi:MAG: hypothetical protein ABR924_02945 [Terracidiphilus sp.]|jgi:hypothetical protein